MELIDYYQPKYYIIENPMGWLRTRPYMEGLHMDVVSYCQYGFTYQKHTCLWHNLKKFKPKKCNMANCLQVNKDTGRHIGQLCSNKRNGHKGTMSLSQKYSMPPSLCSELLELAAL